MTFCSFVIFSSIAVIISARPQYSRQSWSSDGVLSNGYQSNDMPSLPSKDTGSYDDFVMPKSFGKWKLGSEHSSSFNDQSKIPSNTNINPSSNPSYAKRDPFVSKEKDSPVSVYQSKRIQISPSNNEMPKPNQSSVWNSKTQHSSSFDDQTNLSVGNGRSVSYTTGNLIPAVPGGNDPAGGSNIYQQTRRHGGSVERVWKKDFIPSNNKYENRLPFLPKESKHVSKSNAYGQSNGARTETSEDFEVKKSNNNWRKPELELSSLIGDTRPNPSSNRVLKNSNSQYGNRLPFLPKEKNTFDTPSKAEKSVQIKSDNPFANYNPLPPGYIPKGPSSNFRISKLGTKSRADLDSGNNDNIRMGAGNEYGIQY